MMSYPQFFFNLLFVLRAAICPPPDNDGSSCAWGAMRNKSCCFIPEGSGLRVTESYKVSGSNDTCKEQQNEDYMAFTRSFTSRELGSVFEVFSNGRGNAWTFSRVATLLLTHRIME